MGLAAVSATLGIDAALAGIDSARIHSGHPGTAGTSNQIGTDSAAVTFGAGTDGVAVSTAMLTWAGPLSTGGDATWLSLWDGATYRGDAELSGTFTVEAGGDFAVLSVTMAIEVG